MSRIKNEEELVPETTMLKECKTKDSGIEEKEAKPYFFPRLVAYFIDIILVSLICSGVMLLLPRNENYDKYMKEYEQIQTQLIQEQITAEEYLNKSIDVVYDIDYSNVVTMFVQIVLLILYFVVFQFYRKGQTLGKKIMKLRVVSVKEQELTLNQVAYRALIINTIFINVVILGALLFIGRNYYYYFSMFLQFLSGVIIFVTLIMILFRKDGRGLHDVIAGTKVIREN